MFFYSESEENNNEATIQGGPTDPHFDNVVLLMPMSTDFSDSSSHNHTVNTVGDTSIIDSSGDFDGSGDYITVSSPELAISANQAVTIEFDLRFDSRASAGAALFDYGTHNSVDDLTFLCQTNINGWLITPWMPNVYNWNGSTMVDGSWHHVAFTRTSDGSWYSFVDGNIVQSGTGATGAIASNGVLRINGLQNYAGYEFNGGMKNFRITKGVARYTSAFTPPTEAHPTQAGQSSSPSIVTDSLSLHLDAGDITSYPGSGTDWFDISGNGNNAVLTNGPTYTADAGGNFFFDGSNDFAITNNAAGISGDANATLSVWLKVPSLAAGSWKNALTFGNPYSAKGGMAIFVNSGNRQGSVAAGFFMGQNAFTSNNVLAIDSWYNIVFAKEAGAVNSSNTKIYINGQEQTLDFSSVPSTVPNFTNTQVYVGKDSANQMFYGNIAAAMVYTKALSAAEVLQNFDATKTRFGL